MTKVNLDVTENEKNDGISAQVHSGQDEIDLMGTPLECPFDLNVLKIQDEDFYSKESVDSRHHSELKSCQYRPFSSFEARFVFVYR